MSAEQDSELQPFEAMEVLARAQALEAEGRHIVHLELGEPSAPAAPEVRAAVKAAIDHPQRYTNSKGDPALRQGLADYYRTQHGVEVDPGRIFVTMGSSAAFLLSFLAAFEPGDEIALTRPGYPAYFNIIRSLGLKVRELPLDVLNGWSLGPDQLHDAFQERHYQGFLFASPANPTGATESGFSALIKECELNAVRFISDEIYHGLEFHGRSQSALEITDDAIIINSFSKFYCMTGWRVGWMVLPEALCRKAELLAQNLFISPSSVAQTGALAALGNRQYGEAQRDHYRANRDLIVSGLRSLGFKHVQRPDGAFYAYVDVTPFSEDSRQFCLDLLERAGVAATPGIDFDKVDGHKYVRFSFAGPTSDIELALERMSAFVKS